MAHIYPHHCAGEGSSPLAILPAPPKFAMMSYTHFLCLSSSMSSYSILNHVPSFLSYKHVSFYLISAKENRNIFRLFYAFVSFSGKKIVLNFFFDFFLGVFLYLCFFWVRISVSFVIRTFQQGRAVGAIYLWFTSYT